MRSSVDTLPLTLTPVTEEDRTKNHIQDKGRETKSTRVPERLQDFTSLDATYSVNYLNTVGWPKDGIFITFLSTVGYYFREKDGRMATVKQDNHVGRALSVLIFEILPFDVSITPLPQLPTEIWEYIIDWISKTDTSYGGTFTLHACALVCRSWRDRSRLHLYKEIRIRSNRLLKFQTTLRINSSLSLSSVDSVSISGSPVSALFTMSKFVNLDRLRIQYLDLTNEHSVITRGPLVYSVTRLELLHLRSCTLSTLIRFLNSFHSLNDTLEISFTDKTLQHNGQRLPPHHPRPNRYLKHLILEMVPGIDKLIEWYIREGHFLAGLARLTLKWWPNPPPPKGSSYSDGLVPLLGHCADTLEYLKLRINMTSGLGENEIPNNVILSSLPNLRAIHWASSFSGSNFFPVAAMQLSSIFSPCKIIEIAFLITYKPDYEEAKDCCRRIDEVLTGDNFPSLLRVQFRQKIPSEHFPISHSRGLLELAG